MELRGIIPARYRLPQLPDKYDQIVVVNWLDVEQPEKPPAADTLSGWRNREVFWFVRSYDWTTRIYK